ncbi:MAG TPA: tetratricopeptide repeat protein [Azospirillaceae bacterium]|nr:tetratricopeptide repeat protein [Azospirillaceae bacterium]
MLTVERSREDLLREAADHQSRGDLAGAGQRWQSVLARFPDDPTANRALGRLAIRAGQVEAARRHLETAAMGLPGDAAALVDWAQATFLSGDAGEAEALLRVALRLAPDLVPAQRGLLSLLQTSGRLVEAAEAAQRLGELVPEDEELRAVLIRLQLERGDDPPAGCPQPPAGVMHRMGRHLERLGRLTEAVDCCVSALRREPDRADTLVALALLHQRRGDPAAAVACHRRLLAADPAHAPSWSNLGNALEELGRFDEALDAYGEAVRLEPAKALVRMNRAMLLLKLGRWREGWEEYEWRWRVDGAKPPPGLAPSWDGSPVGRRRLLLVAEQGMGDTIQMLRYLPPVAATADRSAGGEVCLMVPPSLQRLLARFPGVTTLDPAQPLPPFDAEAPLLSLPRLLGTEPGSVPAMPAPEAFAAAPGSGAAAWVRNGAGLRVGLAWAGNPGHVNDRRRSAPLSLLEPILSVPGCGLYSLQKGGRAADADRFADRLTRLDHHLGDMADTAAVIRALDMVISVDTGVAHLAAALGKPTWLLLPFAGEWRWLAEGEATPWYPSMRLFRQARRNDWPELAARVAGALARHAGAGTS